MDRLEAAEVKLSYILKSNEIFRIDSNFYLKEFLDNEKLILSQSNKSLLELGAQLKSFGAYSLNNYVEYLSDGIPFIRGVNMKNGSLNFDNMIYISDEAHKLLWKSEVKAGNVLLSMSGTIGDVAIALPTWNYPLNSNQDIAKINLCGNSNPYYLYVFLMSKYGQNYLSRQCRGSVQQHVFLSQIEQLIIPMFSKEFVLKIEDIIIKKGLIEKQSKVAYTDAQNLLFSELGLVNYAPPNKAASIKTFANSFVASGRLDAEYYQPKYEEMLNTLENFNCEKLGYLVNIRKSIEPGSDCYGDEGIPFVRVSNLSKFGITEPDIKIPDDIVQDIEQLYPQKNSILLSKDGSVGIAYKVEETMVAVTSGAILHLMVMPNKSILPDYLALVLNSHVVQLQAERDAGGSIIQHWKPSEIEKVVIPVLDNETQQKISDKVQQSFALRKKSTILLEHAKQAVEIAIEQGENVAMKWLDGII